MLQATFQQRGQPAWQAKVVPFSTMERNKMAVKDLREWISLLEAAIKAPDY
jgi:hypothetical protein